MGNLPQENLLHENRPRTGYPFRPRPLRWQ